MFTKFGLCNPNLIYVDDTVHGGYKQPSSSDCHSRGKARLLPDATSWALVYIWERRKLSHGLSARRCRIHLVPCRAAYSPFSPWSRVISTYTLTFDIRFYRKPVTLGLPRMMNLSRTSTAQMHMVFLPEAPYCYLFMD